jgi:hypothetical protein
MNNMAPASGRMGNRVAAAEAVDLSARRRRLHLRLSFAEHAMPAPRPLPRRSLIGLNAANFFQAEMVGVILPVLNAFPKEANWRYDSIGYATAAAGLGTLFSRRRPAGLQIS